MNDPSVHLRLAALRARRPESAVARLAGDLDPPTGAAVELPPPLLVSQTDHLVDPVVLAGTRRVSRRRSYPAGRARIGVTVAAAASFMALVPVMGPLTAADNDDEPQLPDDEPAQPETTSIPGGSVESTIDLTTTTMSVAPTEAVVVDPATATTTVPTVVPGVPPVAAAPAGPAPTLRGGVAPAAPAPTTPAAPAPAAPTPAPAPSAPVVSAPPVGDPAPTTPAPVATPAPTPPPTVPPTIAPPPPPPPTVPPTTAPPPPTTAPPPPTTSPS